MFFVDFLVMVSSRKMSLWMGLPPFEYAVRSSPVFLNVQFIKLGDARLLLVFVIVPEECPVRELDGGVFWSLRKMKMVMVCLVVQF